MRPVSVTVSSLAASQPIPMEYTADSSSFAVNMTGTLTYSVQVTNDNIFDPTVTPQWSDFSGMSAKTTSANTAFSGSFRACRLNVTAFTSGSATLTVAQDSD